MSFKIILEIETDIDEVCTANIDMAERYLTDVLNREQEDFNVQSLRYWMRKLLLGIVSDYPYVGEIKATLK